MKPYILIVDDSRTNRFLFEELLRKSGLKAHSVSSASEAWRFIREQTPCLILLDLIMPTVSGFEFFDSLKSHKKFSTIPVIVISSADSPKIRQKIKKMSIEEYYVKPVDIWQLRKKVLEYYPGET
ncbi:response regulator [Anaerophaga thermohalophila]|jgi:CheY-like chemotaxis protein|uniref:response regulator n=1 Tax=Anaerophaga thermohalophila TaxID=177400 RepID=UPI00031D1CE3|nr:response regulator [Anaerophaga thermohalophila]